MSIQAQTIISKALRMIGVLASGDSGTATEFSDALNSLNSVIDGLSSDHHFSFCEQDESFTLATKANYCIGNEQLAISSLTAASTTATAITIIPHGLETGDKLTISGAVASPDNGYNITASITVTGISTFTYTVATSSSPATGTPVCTPGDFLTTRPIRLLGAYNILNGITTPMGIITEKYWTNVQDKTTTGTTPITILFRPTYPFGKIYVYPIPTGAPVLHIKSEKFVTKFNSLTEVRLLPPGYQRLLELALAVELSTEYGAQVSAGVAENIKQSYNTLIDLNMRKQLVTRAGKEA